MTVRVERTFELAAPPEAVWRFIADPEKRARAISVVSEFEDTGDGEVWYIDLPIPLVNKTISVRTKDIAREEPRYVKFEGRSSVMQVLGEHEIVEIEGGCRLENRFTVDGRLPGVEGFFERNLDDELVNLEAAIRAELEAER